jgi:cysteinyl-tRNA synthetase
MAGAWADLVYQTASGGVEDTDSLINSFKAALADDLNTPNALAKLNEYTAKASPTKQLLAELDRLFGLDLALRQDISAEQKELIKQREAARQAEDWTKADEIRQQLKQHGIELKDTDRGAVWYRK